jgi:hypothetical protein
VPITRKLHTFKVGDRVKPSKEYVKFFKDNDKSRHNILMTGTVIKLPTSMTINVKWDHRKTVVPIHHTYLEKINDTS